MPDIEEKWAVEYSVYQKQFHIQPIVTSIEMNRRNVITKTRNDFNIIGIVDSFEDAQEFICNWNK